MLPTKTGEADEGVIETTAAGGLPKVNEKVVTDYPFTEMFRVVATARAPEYLFVMQVI